MGFRLGCSLAFAFAFPSAYSWKRESIQTAPCELLPEGAGKQFCKGALGFNVFSHVPDPIKGAGNAAIGAAIVAGRAEKKGGGGRRLGPIDAIEKATKVGGAAVGGFVTGAVNQAASDAGKKVVQATMGSPPAPGGFSGARGVGSQSISDDADEIMNAMQKDKGGTLRTSTDPSPRMPDSTVQTKPHVQSDVRPDVQSDSQAGSQTDGGRGESSPDVGTPTMPGDCGCINTCGDPYMQNLFAFGEGVLLQGVYDGGRGLLHLAQAGATLAQGTMEVFSEIVSLTKLVKEAASGRGMIVPTPAYTQDHLQNACSWFAHVGEDCEQMMAFRPEDPQSHYPPRAGPPSAKPSEFLPLTTGQFLGTETGR